MKAIIVADHQVNNDYRGVQRLDCLLSSSHVLDLAADREIGLRTNEQCKPVANNLMVVNDENLVNVFRFGRFR